VDRIFSLHLEMIILGNLGPLLDFRPPLSWQWAPKRQALSSLYHCYFLNVINATRPKGFPKLLHHHHHHHHHGRPARSSLFRAHIHTHCISAAAFSKPARHDEFFSFFPETQITHSTIYNSTLSSHSLCRRSLIRSR
jgi:hypothetical protein